MEEKKKSNVAKVIFRVIGIILSVVLIPALIFWIPAGGAAIGVSSTVSQEKLVQLVRETKLSEQLLDMAKEEITRAVHSDEVNEEYWQSLVLDSITAEWVDSVITEVLDAAYSGSTPKVTIDAVTASLTEGMEALEQNGFQDLYSAWKDGTPSVYFSESFIQSFREQVEAELLKEYADYGVASFEELETKYESECGEGTFSELLDEKAQSFEEEWNRDFFEGIDTKLETMTAETEQKLNDALTEAVQNPDVRSVFDSLKELNEKESTLKLVVYGVLLGAVLLLVGCFWFGTAGFVVSAVPLILGGILCKLVAGFESVLFAYVSDFVTSDTTLSQFGSAILDVVGGLLTPLFAEVSKLGNCSIIAGVILVGLAIMQGVIKKNKTVAE